MTETTDTTTTTDAPKKQRGRKRISEGGTPSPRKIFCVCSAIVDGNLVSDEIRCIASNNESNNEDVIKEATQIFKDCNGVGPQVVRGPYFDRTGGASKKPRSQIIKIPIEQIQFCNPKERPNATAVYKGWNVVVRYITNRDDAGYITYKTHTSENKKTAPADKVVLLTALEDLQNPEASA